ncbi:hypothetical protein [Methylocystis echinoides]|uniref:hypothetical protein n=1 Tax=Methylocystis echinoides TaxID=29468 RepID=UPI00343DABF2
MKKPSASAPFDHRKHMRELWGEGSFEEAFYCLTWFGDKQPLADYVESGKPFDADMAKMLADFIANGSRISAHIPSVGAFGPFEVVIQKRKVPRSYKTRERYRVAAAGAFARVMNGESLDNVVKDICEKGPFNDGVLRKAIQREELERNYRLPRQRGAYAKLKNPR